MSPLVGLSLILLFIALAVASRPVCVLKGLGFTFVVLATGAAAMTFPAAFISWGDFELKSAITPLVQVILLGMGLTLTLDDFRRVFAQRKREQAMIEEMGLEFNTQATKPAKDNAGGTLNEQGQDKKKDDGNDDE